MAAVELYNTPLYTDANLISYWRYENSLNDEKGTNNLAEGTTPASADTASGKFNHGREFDGTAYNVKTSATYPASYRGAYTLMAWVYAYGFAGSNRVVIAMGTDGVTPTGCNLGVHDDGKFFINYSSNSITCEDGTARDVNTWYCVGATYDGSVLRLYINGSEVKNTATTDSDIRAGNLTIGSWVGAASKWYGRIDDVSLFSRALSPTEMQNYYLGGFTSIKTMTGLAKGSVKTFNNLAINSVKSINSLT